MRQIALGFIATGLLATPAWAQMQTSSASPLFPMATVAQAPAGTAPAAAPAPEPASKKVTVVVGSDFPSLYIFRGVRQEFDADLTFQPFVDVGIAATDKLTFNFGTWNSMHSGTNDGFYESDLYASLTVTAGKMKPGVLWTSYTSPNDTYDAIHELAFFVSGDDSASKMPFSPKVTLAFEVSDPTGEGVYLEFAGKPTSKLSDTLSLSIPLKLGMGFKEYYGDSTFGYFDIGVALSKAVGKGEVHGGVDLYTFGDATKVANLDKKTQAVASVGFSVTF